MRRVRRLTQHITGYFRDEPFQAINCTGSDREVQSRTFVVGGKLPCIYCSVAGNLSTTRRAINTYMCEVLIGDQTMYTAAISTHSSRVPTMRGIGADI